MRDGGIGNRVFVIVISGTNSLIFLFLKYLIGVVLFCISKLH